MISQLVFTIVDNILVLLEDLLGEIDQILSLAGGGYVILAVHFGSQDFEGFP